MISIFFLVIKLQLQKVLYAEGTGTTMDVDATIIHDISLPSAPWDGITYSQNATGVVEASRFFQNSGVEVSLIKY